MKISYYTIAGALSIGSVLAGSANNEYNDQGMNTSESVNQGRRGDEKVRTQCRKVIARREKRKAKGEDVGDLEEPCKTIWEEDNEAVNPATPEEPATPIDPVTPVDPETPETPGPIICDDAALDITFLVDGSGSIEEADWDTSINFLQNLIDSFPTGQNRARFSIMQYSFQITHYQPFTPWRGRLRKKLNEMRSDQEKAGTLTNIALDHAMKTMQSHGRQNVPQFLILLTDGKSSLGLDFPMEGWPDAYNTADKLHELGINSFVVGIGDEVSDDENALIATDPDQDHYFALSDYDSLNNIRESMKNKVCGVLRSNPVPSFVAAGKKTKRSWKTTTVDPFALYGIMPEEGDN